MERVEVLIDKLKQQFHDKAGAEQLLVTVQLIQAELHTVKGSAQSAQAKKSVSVIIPSAPRFSITEYQEALPLIKAEGKTVENKLVEMLEVDENDVRAELEQLKKNAAQHNNWSQNNRQLAEVTEDAEYEIPTLASHQSYQPRVSAPVAKPEPKKEVNEVSPVIEASLNDRLKESKTELAEKLQDALVKDLKKAVGINDRYLYIIELFSGNEAAFDRSIKTLNSFSILPEAEFWMERELKLKLGWNVENPLVKQFIQLVRRRFS